MTGDTHSDADAAVKDFDRKGSPHDIGRARIYTLHCTYTNRPDQAWNQHTLTDNDRISLEENVAEYENASVFTFSDTQFPVVREIQARLVNGWTKEKCESPRGQQLLEEEMPPSWDTVWRTHKLACLMPHELGSLRIPISGMTSAASNVDQVWQTWRYTFGGKLVFKSRLGGGSSGVAIVDDDNAEEALASARKFQRGGGNDDGNASCVWQEFVEGTHIRVFAFVDKHGSPCGVTGLEKAASSYDFDKGESDRQVWYNLPRWEEVKTEHGTTERVKPAHQKVFEEAIVMLAHHMKIKRGFLQIDLIKKMEHGVPVYFLIDLARSPGEGAALLRYVLSGKSDEYCEYAFDDVCGVHREYIESQLGHNEIDKLCDKLGGMDYRIQDRDRCMYARLEFVIDPETKVTFPKEAFLKRTCGLETVDIPQAGSFSNTAPRGDGPKQMNNTVSAIFVFKCAMNLKKTHQCRKKLEEGIKKVLKKIKASKKKVKAQNPTSKSSSSSSTPQDATDHSEGDIRRNAKQVSPSKSAAAAHRSRRRPDQYEHDKDEDESGGSEDDTDDIDYVDDVPVRKRKSKSNAQRSSKAKRHQKGKQKPPVKSKQKPKSKVSYNDKDSSNKKTSAAKSTTRRSGKATTKRRRQNEHQSKLLDEDDSDYDDNNLTMSSSSTANLKTKPKPNTRRSRKAKRKDIDDDSKGDPTTTSSSSSAARNKKRKTVVDLSGDSPFKTRIGMRNKRRPHRPHKYRDSDSEDSDSEQSVNAGTDDNDDPISARSHQSSLSSSSSSSKTTSKSKAQRSGKATHKHKDDVPTKSSSSSTKSKQKAKSKAPRSGRRSNEAGESPTKKRKSSSNSEDLDGSDLDEVEEHPQSSSSSARPKRPAPQSEGDTDAAASEGASPKKKSKRASSFSPSGTGKNSPAKRKVPISGRNPRKSPVAKKSRKTASSPAQK